MSLIVPNIALGAFRKYADDYPSYWGLALLQVAEADDTLRDYDTLDDLLTAAGNTECDFTNYARKTGLTISVTQDNTNNRVDADVADQTYASAGGASNNDIVKAVFYCDPTGAFTDVAAAVPMGLADFVYTTTGANFTLQIPAGGFLRAAG